MWSSGRSYSQYIMPRVKKFLQSSALLPLRPVSFTALHGELGDVGLDDAVAVEGAVLEGVALDLGLLDVLVREAGLVDEQDAALLEVADVGLERGGVHGHQHVEVVARGLDVLGARSGSGRR